MTNIPPKRITWVIRESMINTPREGRNRMGVTFLGMGMGVCLVWPGDVEEFWKIGFFGNGDGGPGGSAMTSIRPGPAGYLVSNCSTTSAAISAGIGKYPSFTTTS
jgi:hypothetical protein